jgi:DNA-binding transcriptional regulator YiaG
MGSHATLPALLRATESALGLTPDAFAEVLQVAPAMLEHWKRGETLPSPLQHATVIDRIEAAVLRQQRARGPSVGSEG